MSENSYDLSLILKSSRKSLKNYFSPSPGQAVSLKDIQNFFTKLPVTFEIIVVSEHSLGETEVKFSVAANLKTAMLKARGAYCFLMSAKLTHPLAEIIIFLTHFYAHPEVQIIVGSRARDLRKILFHESRWQRYQRIWSGQLLQKFYLPKIDDALCEFKAFRQASAQLVFSLQQSTRLTAYTAEIEALLIAHQLQQNVEVLAVRSSAPEPPRSFFAQLMFFWALLLLKIRMNHLRRD